jgi:hypothetical protein
MDSVNGLHLVDWLILAQFFARYCRSAHANESNGFDQADLLHSYETRGPPIVIELMKCFQQFQPVNPYWIEAIENSTASEGLRPLNHC